MLATALCIIAAALAQGRTPVLLSVPREGEMAQLVAAYLPRMHLLHAPIDDRMADAALQTFLEDLDYDRCYFLASDVEEFRKEASQLDDRLQDGDVSFAYRVYDVLKQRVADRTAFADKLIGQGFDFSATESYEWKRKDAAWPADQAAWDELWRKRVKNQLLARTVADQLAAEQGTNKTDDVSLNEEDEDAEPSPADAKLTPEEFVRKGYRQYLTILNDNDPEWVLERYLTAFARAYDPHSDYMSASNTEDFDIGMKLSLTGIGAVLSTEDGAAKIERLIAGGPAEKDGRLKPGDKIIAVAQGDDAPVDILHWPLNKAVRLIRGARNSKVVLTVIPASDISGSTVTRVDIVRDEVKLEEQAAKGDLRTLRTADGKERVFGVIRLPEFYADLRTGPSEGGEPRSSSKDVRNILIDLQTNDLDGIVLDLRNNGGGLLTEAVRMTGLFIDKGAVVQVSNGFDTEVLNDREAGAVYSGPLVVLVNRQTASASEILAGALQDYRRAVIVGDSKTHGKGTVQTLTNLRNDDPALGTLKVTIASFFRIAGGSTQKRGVSPDIVIPSVLDSMEVGEEYLPNAMEWSSEFPALYLPVANLAAFIPRLREQSSARLKDDQRFSAYRDLITKLAERQKEKDISLNLNERLALARNERELQKALEETDKEDGTDKKKDKDIVLDESLNILSDMAALPLASASVNAQANAGSTGTIAMP